MQFSCPSGDGVNRIPFGSIASLTGWGICQFTAASMGERMGRISSMECNWSCCKLGNFHSHTWVSVCVGGWRGTGNRRQRGISVVCAAVWCGHGCSNRLSILGVSRGVLGALSCTHEWSSTCKAVYLCSTSFTRRCEMRSFASVETCDQCWTGNVVVKEGDKRRHVSRWQEGRWKVTGGEMEGDRRGDGRWQEGRWE